MSRNGQEIDWPELHRVTQESLLTIRKVLEPEPEKARETFQLRARQLASRQKDAHLGSGRTQAVVVQIGEERYALDLSSLRGIAPAPAPTPVPGSPAGLLGLVSLRGEILPVAELACLLGLATAPCPAGGQLLVAASRIWEGAFRVDGLEGILEYLEDDLRPLSDQEVPAARYLRGVTRDHIPVIEPDRLKHHPIYQGEGASWS